VFLDYLHEVFRKNHVRFGLNVVSAVAAVNRSKKLAYTKFDGSVAAFASLEAYPSLNFAPYQGQPEEKKQAGDSPPARRRRPLVRRRGVQAEVVSGAGQSATTPACPL
jgi:hypothetical protein